MINKKAATLSFLFLISLQFLISLTYFNLNAGEGIDVENLDPEISDIIVGNYTFPGVPGSIALNESIRIGLLDDLKDITGDHAWKGALLAAREINEAGGIIINATQFYVGLAAEDTDEANLNLDISKGIDAANRILSYDPHFIIGGFRPESVSAYLELIMDAKIPFLSTGLTTDVFCQNVIDDYAKYKYFFRVMPMNSTSLGAGIINSIGWLCYNLGMFYGGTLNKVAILREDLAWTEAVSSALNTYLGSWGITVVQEIAFPIGATGANFNTYWNQIQSAGVQLTIPIVNGPDAITMAQQYRNVKPKCLLAGINVLSQLDTYWDDTEGACQYEILLQNVHRTDKTSLTVPFWDSFVSTYNMEPLYTGVGSYDAVRLLVNASDSINSFNSDDIVPELEGFNQSNPFIGVSSKISFTNSHDLLEGYPYAFSLFCQWQLDGNKVVVPSNVPPSDSGYYPSSLATGSVSVPYWGINSLVAAQNLPEDFTLSDTADDPDKDGTFNLTWTSSAGADNYSVYIYDKPITYLNHRLTLLADQNAASPFEISGLATGVYYCVVVAYNETGETFSNNVMVNIERPRPGNFTLECDADFPDTDGTFNLNWTVSEGADNYSVFTYNSSITQINDSVTNLANQTAISPFQITGLMDGDYYYVVVAYNGTGETLSNNVNLTVVRPKPGLFNLTTDADVPDTDGTFNLSWTDSEGAANYSLFTSNCSITQINDSVTILENQTASSPLLLSGLKNGDYYFVVVAYNDTGETMSNDIYVKVRLPPGQFILSSDAELLDTDGTFNLNWTASKGADNYSVFTSNCSITQINDSVTILANLTAISPFPITGLTDGDYYYVVVAYNSSGETMSNNVYVKVSHPPGQFTLFSDADFPDTDGNFTLTWTTSARATNYSIFQYSKYITLINENLTLIDTIQAPNFSFEITGLDIGFYYYIIQAYNGYNYTESNCFEVNIQFYDEATGFWELAPFVIDDTGNGHYNWSEVVNFPWCSGSGTLNDPYIIEYINIDGNDVTNCITIRESDVFFTIQHSSFFNAGNDGYEDAGIKLIHISNGTLLHLNSSRNNANGIVLDSCQHINITSCSVNHNSLNGILLIDSNYIRIINNINTINYNDDYGIYLIGSDYNNITNNIINNNLIGIYLDDSDFNFIDWNTILGNGEAILNEGIGNYIGTHNITFSGGDGFPFDILLIVLIITIAIFGSIIAVIIVKKRRSISGKKEREISEQKKEKIKIRLEEKLRSVDHLIEGNKIKLAYKNLEKVKDTADRYDFFAIFNQADKKVEICKAIEAGIYTEEKKEELFIPVATEKRKEFKVFLSYSSLDSDRFQIKKIVKHLEKFTEINKVYYFSKDSGQNIVEYMEKTLSVCNIFVLFCTKTSKDSKAVKGEWQSAYQLVKRDIMKIIPVYEDEEDIPLLLIPMLNIRYDEVNFKEFINKLYQEILR